MPIIIAIKAKIIIIAHVESNRARWKTREPYSKKKAIEKHDVPSFPTVHGENRAIVRKSDFTTASHPGAVHINMIVIYTLI